MFWNVTPSQPQSGSWSHHAKWLQCLMWAYEGVGDYPGLWERDLRARELFPGLRPGKFQECKARCCCWIRELQRQESGCESQ